MRKSRIRRGISLRVLPGKNLNSRDCGIVRGGCKLICDNIERKSRRSFPISFTIRGGEGHENIYSIMNLLNFGIANVKCYRLYIETFIVLLK